jgi:sarcosine oxidase
MKEYDLIVLGVGGVGSAALYHAARRKLRVLGLDRFPPGHEWGSSHGETRIIRQAYFEHADYVPLLLRAYELWHALGAEAGEQLLFPVGLLQTGPADGKVVPHVLASAEAHGLKVDSLSNTEATARFPALRIPEGHVAAFEPAAGYLRVTDCVQAHAKLATQHGAQLHTGAAIESWRWTGSEFEVVVADTTYRAAHLVVTAGPWAASLLESLSLPLRVVRKHVYFLECNDSRYRSASGCPTYLMELPDGVFYGFPVLDSLGLKVAEHSGGIEVGDPLADPRAFDEADFARVARFVREHLPGVSTRLVRHSVCHYTLTPDEHFVIDQHPQYAGLAYAAGLSGHGFKFTSVLGEVLVDLALTGSTPWPVQFLCRSRLHC